MKKQFVYQLGLRRADDEKEKFIIEHDVIYTTQKITQKEADLIAKDHKCDVQIQFIGILTAAKDKDNIINATYHTENMIQDKLDLWNRQKPEDVENVSTESI